MNNYLYTKNQQSFLERNFDANGNINMSSKQYDDEHGDKMFQVQITINEPVLDRKLKTEIELPISAIMYSPEIATIDKPFRPADAESFEERFISVMILEATKSIDIFNKALSQLEINRTWGINDVKSIAKRKLKLTWK